MISDKPLDQITKADIEALVENAVPEGRRIEYKREMYGKTDADRKEFLKDISSLANSDGGDLVLGVADEGGIAIAVPGLEGFNEDKAVPGFEQAMHAGLDPGLRGVKMRSVAGFENGPIFVIRVPRSWAGPHRVSLGGSSRFYFRGARSALEMNTRDIRSAIEASGPILKQIRDWRDERLGRILADAGPIKLIRKPLVAAHIVPFQMFGNPYALTASEISSHRSDLTVLASGSWDYRINVDGLLAFSRSHDDRSAAHGYSQAFRSGAIEAVSARLTDTDGQERAIIALVSLEEKLITGLLQCFSFLAKNRILSPIIFSLAFLEAKGSCMAGYDFTFPDRIHVVDRDVLIFPELSIEDLPKSTAEVAAVLRPVFDAMWNALGLPQSASYDNEGNWSSDNSHRSSFEMAKNAF